jgi:hypothetical protein
LAQPRLAGTDSAMRGRDRPLRWRLTLTCGQCADLSPLTGWVVYLSSAANLTGPVRSRPQHESQTLMTSSTEVFRASCSPLVLSRGAPDLLPSRSPSLSAAYSSCGCGHGGTRYRSTSRSVHTRSVSPAAMAGVHGRHCWAEPMPWVGTGCAKDWRKLACGRQKL